MEEVEVNVWILPVVNSVAGVSLVAAVMTEENK